MKYKGALMEYAQERIDDLMRAHDEYISSCRYIRMPEVYSAIVNMPSRRFWVSDIRATLVVSAMMRSETVLEGMWPLKREMYEEIHRRVIALREEYPHRTVSDLCAMVVQQPAPKFYLTPGSAKMMVCKARKEWRKRKTGKWRLW
ncbi:MAG: hypothetical protein Q4E59_00750 [Bacteroidales bacterium]|nr:hypothetical protein [Bacteroidales bacterium]